MPTLCDRTQCTGCGACFNKCPHNSIGMLPDAEGFLQPVVDTNRCTDCKLCEEACPIVNRLPNLNTDEPKAYACWDLDPVVRRNSSSGGLFSTFAESVLEKGGVVFGAAYDSMLRVHHRGCETREELSRLRTSKYVQSDIETTYQHVSESLRAGRTVFFTGTPCQIAGLKSFLGPNFKEQKYLLTGDLVCHGVPSPQLFKKWIRYLESQYRGKIRSLNMRDKKGIWSSSHHHVAINIDSQKNRGQKEGQIVIPWRGSRASYLERFFLKNFCLRNSCSQCHFAQFPRIADVTFADFWGIGEKTPFSHDTKEGVSLLLINSPAAQDVFDAVKPKIFSEERTLDEAKRGNPALYRSSLPHPRRDEFFGDIDRLSFEQLVKKYAPPPKMRFVKYCAKKILGQKFFARLSACAKKFPPRKTTQ